MTVYNRTIAEIATDILSDWKKPGELAENALILLTRIRWPTDTYCGMDGRTIVASFVSSSTAYRTKKSKKLKRELKDLCGLH